MEQYTLTKGKPNTFKVADRRKDPVDEADLRAKLHRIREKGILGEQQLNHKKMEGSKRLQVVKLIEDRNQMDLDPRFEWVVGSVDVLYEPKNPEACRSVRVILQRKPATIQRVVRNPNQPFQMRTRVDLTHNDGAFHGRQNNIHGRGTAYHDQLGPEVHARAMQEEQLIREQRMREHIFQENQRREREQQMREQHAAAMRQGARPDAAHPTANHGNGDGNTQEKAKPKVSSQSPHGRKGSPVIQIVDESDNSASDSDSGDSSRMSKVFDSEAESSSSDTAETLYSDSTRNSRGKAKKSSPKGTSRRNRSESPQSRRSSKSRRERRGSKYILEHKRPVRDNSPQRKTKREPIYTQNDFVEIRPGPGPQRSRRDSEHGGSSYNHWRPSSGSAYSGGGRHERNHSFGLNKGLGNLGFEQKERISDHSGSRHDRLHSFGLNKEDGNLGFEQKERITDYSGPDYSRPDYGRRDYGRPIVEYDREREHDEFLKKKKREVEEESLRVKQRENDLKMKELREKERQMREKEWDRSFSRRESPQPRSRWDF